MTENGHARSANQPEQGRDWRSNQTHGNGDDDHSSIKLGCSSTESADFEIMAVEAADDEHASDDEHDVEHENPVGEQSVDAEHDKDDGIVAGVVAQVVVDTRLHLGEVCRLGDALDVEELGEGAQVGEATAERTGPEALEALAKVEAGRDDVQRDLDASHGERFWGGFEVDGCVWLFAVECWEASFLSCCSRINNLFF